MIQTLERMDRGILEERLSIIKAKKYGSTMADLLISFIYLLDRKYSDLILTQLIKRLEYHQGNNNGASIRDHSVA